MKKSLDFITRLEFEGDLSPVFDQVLVERHKPLKE